MINTHDNNLPEDSDRFFSKKVEELEKKYNIEFKYEIEANKDYLYNLLYDIEDENIKENFR